MTGNSDEPTKENGDASGVRPSSLIAVWLPFLVHVILGFSGSYVLVTTAGGSWPTQLVMFPFFQLGPLVLVGTLVPLVNVLALAAAFACFLLTLGRVMDRREWIIECHLSFAVLWALPALLIRFGEYIGP